MRKTSVVCVLAVLVMANVAIAATVWNPAANGVYPPAAGDWNDAANWTNGVPGTVDDKAVFNVPGAAGAQVTDYQSGMWIVQGDGADGGLLRIVAGGHLDADAGSWSAVGYNANAHTIVEAGGTYSFGNHMWVGFNPGSVGTLDISGTVNVGNQLGLGWNNGTGYVNVLDGGVLNLTTMHSDGVSSIKSGLLDISGTGQVIYPGNYVNRLGDYVDNGKIAGNGIVGNVKIDLTTNPGSTTVTALTIPTPATFVKLADIFPGTEVVNTTIVENGDFEDESSGNVHTPAGWDRRIGDMFYTGAPIALPASSGDNAARIHMDHTDDHNGHYWQDISGLEPNTEYVLSAYMWNLGKDEDGYRGNMVIDFNDAPGEAQIVLSQGMENSNLGYFAYDSFNTADTGTSFTLRAFMVHPGANDGWDYNPSGALWDNISITKASEFSAAVAPEPSALCMAALGLLGLGCCGRRRRERAA